MPSRLASRPRPLVLAALAAGAVAASACGSAEDARPAGAAAAAPAAPAVVRVDAGEWFFRAPARLKAGPVTFRMRNVGAVTHQLAVARLAPGVSVDEAIASGGAGGKAVPLGEVVALPGVTAELRADLAPGRHVLLCFEERRGKPHLALGQKATIDVR